MTKYKNLSGKSGVVAYEYTETSIIIEFQRGSTYEYNSIKPGIDSVRKLIKLADAGQGLSGYISEAIGKNYYRRIK